MSLAIEISDLLDEAAGLFAGANMERWAAAMKRAQGEVHQDLSRGAGLLRGMFGGMGSLSDVVLHRDGIPLAEENDRLDAIRARLYDLTGEVNRT